MEERVRGEREGWVAVERGIQAAQYCSMDQKDPPLLATRSASMMGQPSSRSMAETVLFPEEMPPVSPTRNMILGVRETVAEACKHP